MLGIMRYRIRTLAACVHDCPLAAGVYRLYRGRRLLHIGMAAGAATVRSEVLWHSRRQATQYADRVAWEVAPDALAAYRRFLCLYSTLMYEKPTTSRRHSARARPRRWRGNYRYGLRAKSAPRTSIGTGKTIVEALSPAMVVRVCR